MRRIGAVAVVFALLLSAGWALAQGAGSTAAWIDAPLEWITITASPVGVVAHAADPGGVTEARLDVDGATVAQMEASGETLETVHFDWTPPGDGTYLLEVFGRGAGGEWGDPGAATLVVEFPTTTTTTLPPATTTTAGCSLGVPAPTGPGDTTDTTPSLPWSYGGCQPDEFEIQVSRDSSFGGVNAQGYVGGGARSWTVSPALQPCTLYFWRVRAQRLDVFSPWSGVASFNVIGRAGSCG